MCVQEKFLLVAVVVKRVVTGKGKEHTEPRTQWEEDLSCCINPYLRVDDDDERCTLSHEVCIKIMATWKFNAEVKESLAKLHPLTYCSAKQFLPIRFEIEHHAPPGPWQSGPTDEQHQEDQIGKGSSHPNYLMQTRGKTKQLFSPVSLVILDNHMVSLVKHMLDCNADDFLWTSVLVWYEGSKSVQQNQRCYFYCTHSFPC